MTDTELLNAIIAKYPLTDEEWQVVVRAKAALREKAEREKPKPLTLEELSVMGHFDWVWLVFPKLPKEESVWDRASRVYALYSHEHYGETWIAYAHEPKGEK